MKKSYDFCIIGAGSIGLPLSYYLSSKNYKVVVIDRLSYPGKGQNKSAIGGIRATHSEKSKIFICQRSLDIIKSFKENYGIDIEWYQGGYIFPAYDNKIAEYLKELIPIQISYGLNIEWIDSKSICELVPGINEDGLIGGSYSPGDGYANPLKVADAFYSLSMQKGVDFFFNEEVLGFRINGDVILDVITNRRVISAKYIFNCSGACAREVGKLLDIDIPVYPDSHEAGITEPVKKFFDPMIVDLRKKGDSSNFYFYQTVDGQVIFCMTPYPLIPGYNKDSTSGFLPLIGTRLVEILPRLRHLRVRRIWRGLYPMTPDGLPIVSFDKKYKNLVHLVGMCGQGFMIGPGLGQIVSDLICDSKEDYRFIFDTLSLYRIFETEEKLK